MPSLPASPSAATPVSPSIAARTARAAGQRTLRAGMSGADVALLQRILGMPDDGQFGPRTVGALVAWQHEAGLLADGVAGPATWRALGVAAAAPPVFVAPPVPSTELGSMVLRVLAGMRCLDPPGWAGVLAPHMQAHGITTPLDLVGFLSNTINETGGFRTLSENLHYSAEAIQRTWPKRFPNLAAAEPFARNAYKLAERVYGGRMGNGPEGSGDGWHYRGAGAYQTTGASNMAVLAPILGAEVRDIPDMLREREGAARSACIYWQHSGFSTLAARRDWVTIRKRGNGGTIGMAHVLALGSEIAAILGVKP